MWESCGTDWNLIEQVIQLLQMVTNMCHVSLKSCQLLHDYTKHYMLKGLQLVNDLESH